MLRYAAVKSRRNGRPRIGVPWRTSVEEGHGRRQSSQKYLRAVEEAGGDAVEISLGLSPAEVARLAEFLDGFVLPGSPADIEPRRFGSAGHPREAPPDKRRERTDDGLLDHAFVTGKPVLAICYGTQLLNVHQHGTLVQDIPSEVRRARDHDGGAGLNESVHPIRIESERLAELAGGSIASVNSSHHQAVRTAGRGLRIAARAPDGIIEAVEWTGGPGWVIGVQWHPERMPSDPFAQALFRRLVEEARNAAQAPKARNRAARSGGPRPKLRPKRRR
jgi:putative glutamine amidotransferase